MEQETQVPEWKRKMLEARKGNATGTATSTTPEESVPEWKRKMLETSKSKPAPEIPPAEDPAKAKAPFASAQSSASQSASSAGPAKQASATKAGQKEEPGFWASLGEGLSEMLSGAAPIKPNVSQGELKVYQAEQAKKTEQVAQSAQKKAEAMKEEGARRLTSEAPIVKYRAIQEARDQALQQDALQQGFGPVSVGAARGIKKEQEAETIALTRDDPRPIIAPPFTQAATEEGRLEQAIVAEYQSGEGVRPRFRPEEVQRAKAEGRWSTSDEADLRQDAINHETQKLKERASVVQGFQDTQAGKQFTQLQSQLEQAQNKVKDAEAKLPTNDPKFVEINRRATELSEQLKPVREALKPFEQEQKRIEQEGKALQEIYEMYESGVQIDQDSFNQRVAKHNQDVQNLNTESAPYANQYNQIYGELNSVQAQLGPFAQAYEQYKSAYDEYESLNNQYAPIAKNLQEEQNELAAGFEFLQKKNDRVESIRMTDPKYFALKERKRIANLEEDRARKGVGAFSSLGRAVEGKIYSAKAAINDALNLEYEEAEDGGLTKLGNAVDQFWWSYVNPFAAAGTKFAVNAATGAARLVPGEFLDPLAEELSYFGDYVDSTVPDVANLPMYQRVSKAQSDYMDIMEDKYGDDWMGKASGEEMQKYAELEAAAGEDPETSIRMASARTLLPKFISTLTTSATIMASGGVASGSTRLSAILGARGAGAVGTFGSTMAGTFEDNYKLALKEFGEGEGFFGSSAEQLAVGLTSIEALVETLNLGPFVPAARVSMIRDAVRLAKNGASRADVFKQIGKNFLVQGATEGPLEEGLTYLGQQGLKGVFNAIENANLDDKISFTDAAEAMTLGFFAGGVTTVANDTKAAIQNSTLFAGSMMYAVNNRKDFTEYVNTNVPEADRKRVMDAYEGYYKIAEALPSNISMDDRAKLIIPLSQKENLINAKRQLGLKDGEKTVLSEKIDAQIARADDTVNIILSKGKYGENLAAVAEKGKAERLETSKKMMAQTEALEQKHGVQVRFSPVGGFMIVPDVGVNLSRQQYVEALKEAKAIFGNNVKVAPRALNREEMERRRELTDARDGVAESIIKDENGNDVKIDAAPARPLTKQEKQELGALNERDSLIKEFWGKAGTMTEAWTPQRQARLDELKGKEKLTPEEQAEAQGLEAKQKEFADLGGVATVYSAEMDEATGKLYDELLKLEQGAESKNKKTSSAAIKKLDKFLEKNKRIADIIAKFEPTVQKLEQEGKLKRRCP